MKRFTEIITNWKYSWPAWVYAFFQLCMAKMQMRGPASWLFRGCIIAASLLLAAGKWWGCFFGFAYGIDGIFEEYYKIINNEHIFFSVVPLCIGVIAYYSLMAYLVYRENKKQG